MESDLMADANFQGQRPMAFESMGSLQFKVVVLCFLAILFDGIDTTAIGVVVPTLARSWAIPPASFTAAFLATNLGAVVGYIGCGPIAARIGRRPLIIMSVIWFGVCTLLTAFIDSVTALWILRFVTALGLGGAVPTGIAQAADYAPVKYRDAMTVAVTTGLAAGAMLSGLLGASLIQSFGWQSVFVVGGVLPLLLAPALWLWLPEAPDFRAIQSEPSSAKVWSGFARLFTEEYAARTLLLWGYSFLIFTTNYALISWIPTLLLSFGFTPGRAPVGIAALGVGGVAGNLILMSLAAPFGARRILAAAGLLAIAAILGVAWADLSRDALLVTLAAIGAGLVASSVGQAALAVSIYPSDLRTTGVGCSSALGRLGSIVGPGLGGLMLALGWPAREIVQTACLPVLVAIAILALLSRRG
jgi:AAHS family 4-hydroxybenzoate transporter-like MFS transporter